MKAAHLCLTLCDPLDHTVHGILQATILKWVAFPFSRGSSQSRDQIQVSHIAVSLPAEPQGKPKNTGVGRLSLLQRIFLTQELNCCYNNLSQTGWHKTTDIHSLPVLQNQGVGSVGSFWRLWGRNTVHASLLAFFVEASSSRCSLAYRCVISISTFILPLCVSFMVSYKNTHNWL